MHHALGVADKTRLNATVTRPFLRMIVVPSVVVALAAGLSVLANVPSPWSPFALMSWRAAIRFGPLGYGLFADDRGYLTDFAAPVCGAVAAGLVVTAAFLAWAPGALCSARIPKHSTIALAAIAAADITWLAWGWSRGVEYQGYFHTLLVVSYNVIGMVVCVVLHLRNRRTPSQRTNVEFHTVAFAASGFCAFPWLGELL